MQPGEGSRRQPPDMKQMREEFKFEKALIAVDGSKGAFRACEMAGYLLKMVGAAQATLLYVIPSQGIYTAPLSDEIRAQLRHEAEGCLDAAVPLVESEGVKVTREIVQSRGSTVDTIVRFASDGEFGVVVLGTRGMGGVRKMLLGSVSSGVATHAHCPVLVVREKGRSAKAERLRRILVAVDSSMGADQAVRAAASIAKLTGGELTVLHVLDLPSYVYSSGSAGAIDRMVKSAQVAGERMVASAASIAEKEGIARPRKVVEEALSPAAGIKGYAEKVNADLIVVGTRGIGDFKRLLLGSVAGTVLTYAHCSVLVVR